MTLDEFVIMTAMEEMRPDPRKLWQRAVEVGRVAVECEMEEEVVELVLRALRVRKLAVSVAPQTWKLTQYGRNVISA